MELQSVLQQPGLRTDISQFQKFPTVNLTDVPSVLGTNGVRFHYYEQLGLSPFQLAGGMIRSLGLDQLFMPSHFGAAGMDWMQTILPLPSYKAYRAVGNDINSIVQVRRTISNNGYGLDELVLEVATEAGLGIRVLSRGHLLNSFSDRQFVVVAEEMNGDGFQEITLRQTSLDGQIDVVDGQSVDFPNGSPIGQLGINEYGTGDPDDCEQELNQYFVQPSLFESVQLSRKVWEHTIDKQTNQNNIAGGNFNTFYLNLYGLPIKGGENGVSIATYIDNLDRQTFIKNLSQLGAAMCLARADRNQNGIMQGNGIVESISPQNWYRYRASKELDSRFWYYALDNTFSLGNRGYGNSPENPLVALCGSKAFAATMRNLQLDRQVQFREDPYRDVSRAQGYATAEQVTSMLATVLGTYVRFVKFTPLDGKYFTGQRHPENQNLGIHSGDIIVLPQGTTQEAQAMKDPEFPMATGEKIVNFYGASDNSTGGTLDFMATQYQTSGIRADGSVSQGEVTRFGNRVRFRTIVTVGAEIADPQAGLYITMR